MASRNQKNTKRAVSSSAGAMHWTWLPRPVLLVMVVATSIFCVSSCTFSPIMCIACDEVGEILPRSSTQICTYRMTLICRNSAMEAMPVASAHQHRPYRYPRHGCPRNHASAHFRGGTFDLWCRFRAQFWNPTIRPQVRGLLLKAHRVGATKVAAYGSFTVSRQ